MQRKLFYTEPIYTLGEEPLIQAEKNRKHL